MSMYEVPKGELITTVAKELQKLPAFKPPVWSQFVKTGPHKERPPVQGDWWHVRAAAVLRRIAETGPVGTSKLRKHYGGKRNRGFAPERAYPGSGNIIRKILQQLEKSGLVKQVAVGVHKGRKITPQGTKILDSAAKILMQQKGIVLPKKPVAVPVEESKPEPAKKPRKRAAPRKKKETKEEQPAQPVENEQPKEQPAEN